MALIPIKTASETGYCDCICGCYELASLRDEDTGKGYCPACGKKQTIPRHPCSKEPRDRHRGSGRPLSPATVAVGTRACSSAHVFASRCFQNSPRGSALAPPYHFASIRL